MLTPSTFRLCVFGLSTCSVASTQDARAPSFAFSTQARPFLPAESGSSPLARRFGPEDSPPAALHPASRRRSWPSGSRWSHVSTRLGLSPVIIMTSVSHVEGGVSPPGIPFGSRSVSMAPAPTRLPMNLSASPSPQPSPKGEGVAYDPRRLGQTLPRKPSLFVPADPRPSPSKPTGRILPLPPAGEGRGEGRPQCSSRTGSWPVTKSISNTRLATYRRSAPHLLSPSGSRCQAVSQLLKTLLLS